MKTLKIRDKLLILSFILYIYLCFLGLFSFKIYQDNFPTQNGNFYILTGFLFITLLWIFIDIKIIRVIIKQIENGELTLLSSDVNGEITKKSTEVKENLSDDYKLIEEATLTLEYLKQGKFGNRLHEEAKTKELNALKNVMNEMINNLEKKIQEEILQRTNQEKLMIQQSKLAAMGEMIANIAHQWRQPIGEINAILMEVETISRYGNLKKEHLIESIKSCNEITEHMSNTISDFQSFFKPTKDKDDFSVLNACKKAISIINASLKNNSIELIFDIKEDNIINGYPSEFSHAILNIISNAKDVLVLRKIVNPKIILSIKVGKKFTLIKIEDNAGGVNLENIDSIFEPYFTTKHPKKGTGIGLYMTKMIIENNMHGFVKVSNSKDGAIFTIKVK
ncbi:MAG: HAMP domain-containing sensor histidine kinase [Arcobacteraceae bacterium]